MHSKAKMAFWKSLPTSWVSSSAVELSGVHGDERGSLGPTHDSLKAWGSRDKDKEINRGKKDRLEARGRWGARVEAPGMSLNSWERWWQSSGAKERVKLGRSSLPDASVTHRRLGGGETKTRK